MKGPSQAHVLRHSSQLVVLFSLEVLLVSGDCETGPSLSLFYFLPSWRKVALLWHMLPAMSFCLTTAQEH